MNEFDLRAVDGCTLSPERRALLRPGEDDQIGGIARRLPQFFYEVPSWERAKEIRLTPHFTLAELMLVDCREADLLVREFPHYVPCAIVVLAGYLEAFRVQAGASVYVASNGSYRSPAHALAAPGNLHHWGTAANIYRVGDTWLDEVKKIEKYRRVAESLGASVYARAATEGDDHLHVDLGFVTVEPRLSDR